MEKQKQENFDALSAENVALRKSLTELLALWDDFRSDVTYENAYYSFYKGEYDKWENARNLLANANCPVSGDVYGTVEGDVKGDVDQAIK